MNARLVLPMAALLIAAIACNDSTGTRPAPQLNDVAVTTNATNVLSAIVTVDAVNADSVRVLYWTGNEAKRSTPAIAASGAQRVVVLGLRPQTRYNFTVVANGGGGSLSSNNVVFKTGALSGFLDSVSFTSASPSTGGYLLTVLSDGSTAYAVAFDSTGRLAWYRGFPGEPSAVESKQQSNGDITVMLSTSHGGETVPSGRGVALAPDGSIIRTFTAPDSAFLDPHELWELFDANGQYNGALYFTYTQRHVDLSSRGGPADTVISGHQLVREDAGGNRQIVFDAWDHFTQKENVEPTANAPDFDHPNAISFTSDGNYLVSWRDLDALTKIDASTGALVWTIASPLSAIPSDFTVSDDPLQGFSAQHSARVLDNGNLLIFDNGTRHATQASRAVEYQIDESAHTMKMVWQFQHVPAFYTPFTGSVQRLANGNTLIGYPFGGPLVATEVMPSGAVAWEGTLQAPGPAIVPYRFTKISSLYRYVRP